AIALSDMIIVVQSEPSSWESHLHCNGHSLLMNLRQPIKAAVAATAEHLAGLLPLHLVYGQAHETAMEDWIWSVGCNPFSATSQGWHISQFQSDSIARSYVITTLEESIQLDFNISPHVTTRIGHTESEQIPGAKDFSSLIRTTLVIYLVDVRYQHIPSCPTQQMFWGLL
ncbi:hypothetical protein L195_g030456, partial [Trifolium pratense]